MKKIYVFFAGTLLFSSPVFAQKLGSFSNPNVSGTAGAFSVYTPEEIQELDEAGHDVSLAVESGTSDRTPKRRRRPNAWVLSGGVLSAEEQRDLYEEQDAFMQEREAKKKIPVESRKNARALRTQNGNNTGNSTVTNPAGNTGNSTATNQFQERATTTSSSERNELSGSTNSVVSNERTGNVNENANINTQNSGETNANNSQINAIDENTLVCRKYEKCAICERKKPFWNGRECASSRAIKKMKKREEAQAARNGNLNGNGQGNAAVSQNGREISSDLTGTQGQNGSSTTVQETGTGTTQTDSTLNPDGTKKSKKQLKRDRQKSRTKKSKK